MDGKDYRVPLKNTGKKADAKQGSVSVTGAHKDGDSTTSTPSLCQTNGHRCTQLCFHDVYVPPDGEAPTLQVEIIRQSSIHPCSGLILFSELIS